MSLENRLRLNYAPKTNNNYKINRQQSSKTNQRTQEKLSVTDVKALRKSM